MKKLILILVLLTTYAYSQTKVSDMDSITTMVTTDLFWINKDIGSSTFAHRQLSWTNLRNQMIDYIDGLANTWALKQTYSSGATFSAGANGKASFADSVYCSSFVNVGIGLPLSPGTGFWGISTQPFYQMTALNFIVPNSEGNDSVSITYDDSTLSFSKDVSIPNLTISETFIMDSAATIQSLKINHEEYTIANVGDTVITPASLMSNIELALPGYVTKIEKINMSGSASGHIIILTTYSSTDSVTFYDNQADGNLKLAGNFTMGQYDNLALIYIDDQGNGFAGWIEIWRKDN